MPRKKTPFELYCAQATDGQLEAIIAKEYAAKQTSTWRHKDYVVAKREAKRRGWIVCRDRRVG